MVVKIYLVGGSVRDKLLKRNPTDFDYAVDCENYQEMRNYVLANGYEIYFERPQHRYIKARKSNFYFVDTFYDFTMCRPNIDDPDGPANIMTDLSRRDFTINAMALDESNHLIDPYDGMVDLTEGILDFTGTSDRNIIEDPLRILRAIRFSSVFGFKLSDRLTASLRNLEVQVLLSGVDKDRIRKELTKMFAHNTIEAMTFLFESQRLLNFPQLLNFLFTKPGIKLIPVTKEIKIPR